MPGTRSGGGPAGTAGGAPGGTYGAGTVWCANRTTGSSPGPSYRSSASSAGTSNTSLRWPAPLPMNNWSCPTDSCTLWSCRSW